MDKGITARKVSVRRGKLSEVYKSRYVRLVINIIILPSEITDYALVRVLELSKVFCMKFDNDYKG